MKIDSKQYTGPCACGRAHELKTKLAIIEEGCLHNFDAHMDALGLGGFRVAVYDEGSYSAEGLLRPRADQEIVLAVGMEQAEAAAQALSKMSAQAGMLIAVGAGEVHDVVRYCAARLSLPYVSCPTAASTDAFCAEAPDAQKAPVAVLADIDVIKNAPRRLMLAGIAEALSKFTALVDCKVAHLLSGESMCPVAESMARAAAVAAQGCCERLAAGDSEGVAAQLMYGLGLSGLQAQMQGSVAPAAGAAHHMERLMALMPEAFGGQTSALHGERIGVLTSVLAGAYHALGRIDAPMIDIKAAMPREEGWFAERFGTLTGPIMEENRQDVLLTVDRLQLLRVWPEIRRAIAEIPTQAQMQALLAQAGAPSTLGEIGLRSADVPALLELSPYVYNRLTLLRLMRLLSRGRVGDAHGKRHTVRASRSGDTEKIRAQGGAKSPTQ